MTGQVLSWLLFVLALVTPVTALVDWLAGDEGVRRNKDRLAAWYVFIQDGDWSRFLSSTASTTDDFLDKLLGHAIFPTRAVVVWLIISSSLSLVAFLVNHIIQQLGIEESLVGVIGLFCVDFVALAVSRLLLRKLATSSGTKGIGIFLATSCALAYLCIGIFMAAGNLISVGERSIRITGTPESWLAALFLWPVQFVSLIDWTGHDAELGRYSPSWCSADDFACGVVRQPFRICGCGRLWGLSAPLKTPRLTSHIR
jgi:hypothetical protein